MLVAAGLGLAAYSLLTFGDPSEAREYADASVEALSDSIDLVQDAMGEVAASGTARVALDGDDQALMEIRAALREAGVRGIMDVRVFPPRAEDIELGNYPEPDFGVVEMLIEARRQDTARARIHYPSSSNENLAFAEAIPDADGDAIVGMLFVRLEPDRLLRQLADPGGFGWLRLVQDDNVLVERAQRPVPADDRFRLVVPGSELVIEWGVLPSKGPLTLFQSLGIALLGVALLGAAAVLPRLPERRIKPGRKARKAQPAAADVEERRVEPRAPKAPPPRPEPRPKPKPEPEKDEPRPDLPDWMVEDGGLDEHDSPFADQPTAASRSSRGEDAADSEEAEEEPEDGAEGAEVDMDVPDLDEILASLDSSSSGESAGSTPEAADEGKPEAEPDDRESLDEEDEVSDFELGPDVPPEAESEESGAEPVESGPDSELEPGADAGSRVESGTGESDEPETESESPPGPDLDVEPGLQADPVSQSDEEAEAPSARDAESELTLEPERDLSTGEDEAPDAAAEMDQPGSLESSPESSDPDAEAAKLLDEMRLDFEEDSAPPGEISEETPDVAGQADADIDEEADDGAKWAVDEETASDERVETAESTPPEPVPTYAPELFHDQAIRGVFEDTLDIERAVVLGRSIGTLARRRGLERFVVGRDGRFSGPVLLSAMIRGLREAGLDVIELGALPTPLLWFGAVELAEGCGVMVTASHHASEENGFLVMLAGEILCGSKLAEIDEVAARGEFSEGEGGYEQEDIVERYTARFTAEVQLERPLKVVIDCGNGIAGSVAPALLEAAGVDVIPLYCDVDGSFPNHPPDPAKTENLEDLRLCVRNFQADAGIALDGDGDALAMVSDTGDVVRADQLLMLLAEPALSARAGSVVVVDVRCPATVRSWIEKAGGRAVVERTGAGYVAAAMRADQAALGAAMTSHLLVADRWYPFEDGVHAAARVLEVMAAQSGSVSAALEQLPGYLTTGELTLPVENGEVAALIERLVRAGDFGDAERTTIEGLRIDHPDRWGLIRPLDTEGLAGLSFGADNAEGLKRIKTEFREQLLAANPELVLPY